MGGVGLTYEALTLESVPTYLRTTPVWETVLGGPRRVVVEDLADGNVNLVFRVREDVGDRSVIVKQALPYARAVGTSFPLPLNRAAIEHRMLVVEQRLAPDFVPRVWAYDARMHVLVLEDLRLHRVLRGALINRERLPHLADHLATFLAHTLFYTSDLALDPRQKKRWVARTVNPHLCRVTEDLVFTEPFVDHPHNHWNPLITDAVHAVWADEVLLAAVADLKWAFMTRAEALIHGDLHTGSVMVTATDTRVIDPEFGFYGPMGFDVGALLANFALNYLAQPAWGGDPAEVADYRRWLLEVSQDVWDGFAERFIGLWQEHGPAWTPPAYRRRYMARLFHDAVGFAGVKMIRRIIGLAHVADLDGIEDLARRAEAERAALAFARRLIVDREQMDGIGEFIDRLEAIDRTGLSAGRP